MQILTYNFSKKKSDFHSFFSSIVQLVQKLCQDIMFQIDKEFLQASQQFKGLPSSQIQKACITMQNERSHIYEKMIDRLCISLKNFSLTLSKRSDFRQEITSKKSFSDESVNPDSKVSEFYPQFDKEEIPYHFKRNQNQKSSNPIYQQDQRVSTPVQKQKQQEYVVNYRIPSPFSQRSKASRKQQSDQKLFQLKERSRSKQKLQILKKNDICQSIDNYLYKQAKQMLYKSQNRSIHQSPYSSKRKANLNSNNIGDLYKKVQFNDTDKEIETLIENKFGRFRQTNSSVQTKRIKSQLISPIQTFKID